MKINWPSTVQENDDEAERNGTGETKEKRKKKEDEERGKRRKKGRETRDENGALMENGGGKAGRDVFFYTDECWDRGVAGTAMICTYVEGLFMAV